MTDALEDSLVKMREMARWWKSQSRQCFAGFCFNSFCSAASLDAAFLGIGHNNGLWFSILFVCSLGCFSLWRTARRRAKALGYAAKHGELLLERKFSAIAVEHHYNQAQAALNSLDSPGGGTRRGAGWRRSS